ncbi:single-stranded-DNA-specific exonuclease RecJ [Bombilactobacillus bombi]|uniref:Single-stranded-DNA-specific exonuclease RecJ n=1 Tax=Bombilactobacillus bombi TaxID=1303590 RepID=A0A3R6XUF8_9LACO|nr:single-stranded-DNA-specific exonuclease RecJ [Bombilactobacillus bombi]RHW49690.1 single-stranded-DNA-specific exonuclease RecJ [Bombilactobacillus bombi]
MSLKYQWHLREQPEDTQVKNLAHETGLSTLVTQILVQRGLKTPQQVHSFLQPQIADLHDPYLLHDMDIAVERLTQAIFAGEKILIYGDYDADGITSAAILREAIMILGGQVTVFIPDRFVDGYGPNQKRYEQFVQEGYQLIVTVDNGVTGLEEIQYAQEHKVDVIITDHHTLPPKLPLATAIVHPQYPGSNYPCPDLSGAGVAFKVASALLDEPPEELLDLAAIGTVADMVELKEENRVLVTWGLKQIQNEPRLGIEQLCKQAHIKLADFDEETIGFQIAPRLNALGRMDDATKGVELLTTSDLEKAKHLAQEIDKLNQQRKDITAEVFNDAYIKAQEQIKAGNQLLIIAGENWHRGVLGIVAGKIVDLTNHPTVILDILEDGLAVGSGRSNGNFDLYQALAVNRKLYQNFGGHAQACGVTLAASDLEQWRQQINVLPTVKSLDTSKKTSRLYDLNLSVSQINLQLLEQLQQLAPFGQGNPLPIIKIDQFDSFQAEYLGKKTQNHVKIKLRQQQQYLDIIAFGWGQQLNQIQEFGISAVYGSLRQNKWRKQIQVQLNLQDVEEQVLSTDEAQSRLVDLRQTHNINVQLQQAQNLVFFHQHNFQKIQDKYPQLNCVLASDLNTNLKKVSLVDRPPSLNVFEQFVKQNQHLERIELIFHTYYPAYYQLNLTPQVWHRCLKYFLNHKNLTIKNLASVAKFLKLSNLEIKFVLKVFSELNFVKIENGFLINPEKIPQQQLVDSKTYCQIRDLAAVQTTLIDSHFDEIIKYTNTI